MSPLIIQGLLPLPEGATDAPPRLPWANGSILSARIQATDDPKRCLLILGGHRLLAKVPPSIAKGNAWLQILDRNLPAHFRLLTAKQVETEVAQMLRKHVHAASSKEEAPPQTKITPFEQLDLPYRLVAVHPQPPRWLLIDEREEAPHGMLRAEVTATGFQLSGRFDLDHLGKIAFILSGAPGLRLALFAGDAGGYHELRQAFAAWLETKREEYGLIGSLHPGLPEDGCSPEVLTA